MTVDLNTSVSLEEFVRVAAGDGMEKKIRATGSTVERTRLPTWASTNQATLKNFAAALRKEFGTEVADAAIRKLDHNVQIGKEALKGKTVHKAFNEAINLYGEKLQRRDRFFDGPEPNFQTAMRELGSSFRTLPPGLQETIAEKVRVELLAQVSAKPVCPETEEIKAMLVKTAAFQAAQTLVSANFAGRDLPGTGEEKFDLLRQLYPDRGLALVVMQKYAACKAIQPQGAFQP